MQPAHGVSVCHVVHGVSVCHVVHGVSVCHVVHGVSVCHVVHVSAAEYLNTTCSLSSQKTEKFMHLIKYIWLCAKFSVS